jgi:hypothetical protein
VVSTLFSIQHEHCAQCGEQKPLFVLHLQSQVQPRLLPKAEDTHTGICMECWGQLARGIYATLVLAQYDKRSTIP